MDRSRHHTRFTILAVSEGAKEKGGTQVARHDPRYPDPVRLGGIGNVLAEQIEERTGVESRCTVLGYVQRGGTPVPADRVLATEFGHKAVELLMGGEENRLVVMKGRTVEHIPLMDAAGKQRLVDVDHPLIKAARAIGTSFGE